MTLPQITLSAVPGIPLIRPGDDLAEIILGCLREADLSLQDGDVLVIAQKIVSKAEGRLVAPHLVEPSCEATALAAETSKAPELVEIILGDSCEVVRHRPGVLVVEQKSGFICANAGVDHSNVPTRNGEPQVALLPADPDESARRLRKRICQATGRQIAVIINDSHGRPFRLGTCGVAIGVAGMTPLSDRRGDPDLFGQPLRITTVGTADEIAAAASLLMGQADEGLPVVLVRGATYQHADGTARDLLRPREHDLFREPIPQTELLNLLFRRQSIRRYQRKPVDRDTLQQLLTAACAAPSAHNRQHWRFAAITADDAKAHLAQALGEHFRRDMREEGVHPDEIEARADRSYHRLVNAPALIVVGYSVRDLQFPTDDARADVRPSDTKFKAVTTSGCSPLRDEHASSIERVASSATDSLIRPFADSLVFKAEETMAIQSVAAAIENLLLAATALGLGACWICWPLFCPDVVRTALGLPPDFQAQALITLGYPAESPPRRERVPLSERVYFFLEDEA
jgi:coenzyme F420-0:L-glutamate ligase/coenzyme F420-1:gamma-L-glutamate ligase